MTSDLLPPIHRVRRAAWTLPLAGAAALLLVGINEAVYERSTAALSGLGARAQARVQIQLVWRALVDAETGQRGYLLSGRKDDLVPYQRSAGTVKGALDWLDRYYAGDAEAAPVLAQLAEQGIAKLSELDTTLQLYERGGSDSWRELMLTDIGREKMDGLRVASQQLLEIETRRVDRERTEVLSTVRLGRAGVSVMTVLSLLVLLFFLRRVVELDRARRRHADALRAEHGRLAAAVANRTAGLTELARHLQTAREAEKGHLARELHDELGALLTAAKLDAARLKRLIGEQAPEARERLEHLTGSVNRGIELKRRIIEDLRPSSLANLGLVATLEILAREAAARDGVPVRAVVEAVTLAESAQTTVFRLVQEALANVARHAGASEVAVSLQPEPRGELDGAVVSVRDNGRGFDPSLRRGSAHGLMGLRYRIEAEGGHLTVTSAPGQGTLIEAWLPSPQVAAGGAPPAGAVG
jgi:signal transduction histidine kinase